MKPLTNLPAIAKLSSRVIRILGCNPGPMTLQGTNTYLVGTGTRRVLVDAGDADTANEYTKLLNQVLRDEKATIGHLILTHWHPDHMGGVDSVQKLLKNFNSTKDSATVWKLPRSQEDTDITEVERTTNWELLKDEQTLEVEGAKLCVKHTPGHTTDHACLLLENDNILLSGDCILGERTTVFEDLHDYMMSLNKILKMAPKHIYPGHGPVLENPITDIKFYIEHRQKREDEILKILQEKGINTEISEMDIVQELYKETPKNLWIAAASNVGLHLVKLLKEGKVKGEKGLK